MEICPICGKPQIEINRDHPLSEGLVTIKVFDEPSNRYCTCDSLSIAMEGLKGKGIKAKD